jgi:predicted nucleic acid-binding protein
VADRCSPERDAVPFTVIYDANVLYPFHLRDILIRVAQAGLVHARWTDKILDEWFDNLTEQRPELTERLKRTRTLMSESIRDVLVQNYENLIDGLKLPHDKDRHVLAAAIKAGAQVIVTFNTKHFPPEAIDPYGTQEMEAQHPDTFLFNVIDLNPKAVAQVIRDIEADLQSRPGIPYVLEALANAGLARSVEAIKAHL